MALKNYNPTSPAPDSSGDLIRVMTVHGAKGLEAPIVILPDTMRQERASRDAFVLGDDDLPLWNMSGASAPKLVRAAKEAQKQRDAEERQRLLYVAMTRASSWLIVAGTEPLRGQGDDRWHGQIADGLRRAGAVELPFGDGETMLRLEAGGWPTGREDEAGD